MTQINQEQTTRLSSTTSKEKCQVAMKKPEQLEPEGSVLPPLSVVMKTVSPVRRFPEGLNERSCGEENGSETEETDCECSCADECGSPKPLACRIDLFCI